MYGNKIFLVTSTKKMYVHDHEDNIHDIIRCKLIFICKSKQND